VDLSTFIVAVFCLIDDRLKGRRIRQRGPAPERSALLSRLRYRIDTVFSQLTGRYSVKRVWA
jgi:hypothetical protein